MNTYQPTPGMDVILSRLNATPDLYGVRSAKANARSHDLIRRRADVTRTLPMVDDNVLRLRNQVFQADALGVEALYLRAQLADAVKYQELLRRELQDVELKLKEKLKG